MNEMHYHINEMRYFEREVEALPNKTPVLFSYFMHHKINMLVGISAGPRNQASSGHFYGSILN